MMLRKLQESGLYCLQTSLSFSRTRLLSTTSIKNQLELTSKRYKAERGNYSEINDQDVSFFRSVLSSRCITDPEDIEQYNVDWLQMVKGASKLLLKPKTSEEVSKILSYCNARQLAVCPQGGNTGLVGGSVPVFDEIILSTSLMNQIISLDELTGVLVCEAGCVLETLNNYLSERNLIMPLDLGAKGSCQIGGIVSTNAGGLRLFRYGNLHGNVLGLEAVLANGTVLDCLNVMKKDNTGYDLKHLFIGSEGTLGFVTKVAIQCPVKPKSVKLAFLGLTSFENVLQTFKCAKENLSEIISSCEYMDYDAVSSTVNNLKLRNPIGEHKFYMMIETSGSNEAHDQEKLDQFLEKAMENGIVADGTLAADSSQMDEMWAIRERIPIAQSIDGYSYTYDLSIPLTAFDAFIQDVKARVGNDVIRVVGFGHLGDGNIHFQATAKEYSADTLKKIEPFVYEWTSRVRGSVSSEHGLGFRKRDCIYYSKPRAAVQIMKTMKQTFDPHNILNPYKVLPDAETGYEF